MYLKVLLALFSLVSAYEQDHYEAGRKQYETIVIDSRHPKYGPCWTRVLDDVHYGCRRLTEDTQHRLALGFTNCFLAKTGRKTYDTCSWNELDNGDVEVSTCVKDMDAAAFTAYTNFFTHAQSLCYFLENVRWQEKAELTVSRLIEQTINFEQRLRDWNVSVLSFENKTLHLQSHLIDAGARLRTTLDQSQAAVSVMRQASADQHAIIRDVFKQLTSLQEMVVDEFAGFYAYAYYVASTGLAYVLTSTPRTEAARVPLLAVTSSTFAIERFFLRKLVSFCLNFHNVEGPELEVSSISLHSAVWWLRRVAVGICLIALSWAALTYRDLHTLNHSLLEGVAREQRHLREIYSQITLLRNAIRERSLTPTNDNNKHRRHHHHRHETTPKIDENVTPTPSANTQPFSPPDADDEGDGGNDDNISVAGSTVSSVTRYNLRSAQRLSKTGDDTTLRTMTPTSTTSSVRSRSRSRSRSRRSVTPRREMISEKAAECELLASVEASARRTARSARFARLTAQREEKAADEVN